MSIIVINPLIESLICEVVLISTEYMEHCTVFEYSIRTLYVTSVQARTVHRGQGGLPGGARAPQSPRLGGGTERGGTAVKVPANAFTLYIYFKNGNRSVKADFC